MTKNENGFDYYLSIEDPLELERDLGRGKRKREMEKIDQILNGIENWSTTVIQFLRNELKTEKKMKKKLKKRKIRD